MTSHEVATVDSEQFISVWAYLHCIIYCKASIDSTAARIYVHSYLQASQVRLLMANKFQSNTSTRKLAYRFLWVF